METSNVDLTNDFMCIAKVMVKKSEGKLRLAYKEKSTSLNYNKEAQHFLKLNETRIRKDIESYGLASKKDSLGHSLPSFLFLINETRTDCPESYKAGMSLLYKIGNKVFEGEILDNWNRIFQFYLGP